MKCNNCQSVNKPDAKFCTKCGMPTFPMPPAGTDQPRSVNTPTVIKILGLILLINLLIVGLGMLVNRIYHKDPEPTLEKFSDKGASDKGVPAITPGSAPRTESLPKSRDWRWVRVPKAGSDPMHPQLSKELYSTLPGHPEYRLEYGHIGNQELMVVLNGNINTACSLSSVLKKRSEGVYMQFYSKQGPDYVFAGYILDSLPAGGAPTEEMLDFLRNKRADPDGPDSD